MSNVKTLLDDWSVKDLEDNSSLRVVVEHGTELGNQGMPGLQVFTMGIFITYEPSVVERWAYQAAKAGVTEYLLEDKSWLVHHDQYVKLYLLTGERLKAKVVVKTRSSKPMAKEYDLPFAV